MTGNLRIENVHAAYGKKEVLRGVTLGVTPGEVVALIGPNGAGKSTVLRVAAGLLAPTEGTVWLGDRDVTHIATHRRIDLGLGYSMQRGRVFASLTVPEHLEMGTKAMRGLIRRKVDAALLDLFPNLSSLLDRRAGLLSGGEQQGLSLMMALARQPHVLLLDEPSTGLSPRLVRDVLTQIRKISSEHKIGVLLVEQNVTDALRIADRAVALMGGTVALATDSPASWLKRQELESLIFGHANELRSNSFNNNL